MVILCTTSCCVACRTSLCAHPALSVSLRRLAVAGHVTRHIDGTLSIHEKVLRHQKPADKLRPGEKGFCPTRESIEAESKVDNFYQSHGDKMQSVIKR